MLKDAESLRCCCDCSTCHDAGVRRGLSQQAGQADRDCRAGGGEDMEARAIAPFVEKHLGQPVVIENQPGAGARSLSRSSWASTRRVLADHLHLPQEHHHRVPGQDGLQDQGFHADLRLVPLQSALVVNADTWKTVAEFVKAAKERPLSGGLSGRGSTTHLMD